MGKVIYEFRHLVDLLRRSRQSLQQGLEKSRFSDTVSRRPSTIVTTIYRRWIKLSCRFVGEQEKEILHDPLARMQQSAHNGLSPVGKVTVQRQAHREPVCL